MNIDNHTINHGVFGTLKLPETKLVEIFTDEEVKRMHNKYVLFMQKKPMNTIRINIENMHQHGPIIQATIYPSVETLQHMKDMGKNLDIVGVKITALIDTGSNRTIVERNVIDTLQLEQYATDIQSTAHGSQESGLYKGSIRLPISEKEVISVLMSTSKVDFKESKTPYNAIIGRDVLKYCSFRYDGWSNSYDLSICKGEVFDISESQILKNSSSSN